jgi:hypothetical protein
MIEASVSDVSSVLTFGVVSHDDYVQTYLRRWLNDLDLRFKI